MMCQCLTGDMSNQFCFDKSDILGELLAAITRQVTLNFDFQLTMVSYAQEVQEVFYLTLFKLQFFY